MKDIQARILTMHPAARPIEDFIVCAHPETREETITYWNEEALGPRDDEALAAVVISEQVPRAYTWKTDVWDRTTDDEAEALDAALKAAPAKVRRFWDDSQRIWHDHPLFEVALKQPFEDLYPGRADVVFQASGYE